MTNWKTYYENYPVNQELIWLNNCGTTPVGRRTITDVTRYLEAYSKQGVFNELEKYSTCKKAHNRDSLPTTELSLGGNRNYPQHFGRN
jgi:hypothetical protein